MTIRIQDGTGRATPYPGLNSEAVETLVGWVRQVLASKDHVLICLTGNKGVGKSTLGRSFRKAGLGPIRPREIAVIDDDCMSVDFLFFFRRRYANPCLGVDELRPFERFCRKKKVRFYVKSNPEARVTRADILLEADTAPRKRKERLIRRYGEARGVIVFNDTQSYEHHPRIHFRYRLKADLP
jgi:hypothetical protein